MPTLPSDLIVIRAANEPPVASVLNVSFPLVVEPSCSARILTKLSSVLLAPNSINPKLPEVAAVVLSIRIFGAVACCICKSEAGSGVPMPTLPSLSIPS